NLKKGRLRFETLEDRCTPATITVTSLADFAIGAVHTGVTLRDAVEAANTDTSINGSVAGSGSDVIQFDPSLLTSGSQVITMLLENGVNTTSATADTTQTVGASALRISTDVTIQGPAGTNGLTIAAQQTNAVVGGTQRIFTVGAAGALTINDV